MPHTVVQHVQCTRLALALVLTGIVLPSVSPDEAMLARLSHGPAGLVALITLCAIQNWTNSLYPYSLSVPSKLRLRSLRAASRSWCIMHGRALTANAAKAERSDLRS